MDNNNQNPNQNPKPNGYTNFNNYQPSTPPQDNAPVPPQGNPQFNPYQQPAYAVSPQQPQKSGTGFGIAAIVLGCIGCCCFPFGIIGAILGIVGVVRDKKSVVSWIGIVLCVIATIASAIYWFSIFHLIATDPDAVRQIYEDSGIYTEEQIEAMMDSLYGFIISRLC